MSEAPITIAIPVYNREEIVKRTLESVANQTYRPLKVILVNNNSSDNTGEVLLSWKTANEGPDFRIDILDEETPGACAARNRALEFIDTPWTMFFDSDDIMPPDHIEKAVDAIESNPDAQVVGWARKIHFIGGKTVTKTFSSRNMNYENLTQSIFATQNYLARNDIFKKSGGWDRTIKVGQDIELGSRIIGLNPKIIFIPNHFVDVYDSSNSITNTQSLDSLVYTLEKIRKTLPSRQRYWVDLQIIIKAASWAKNDPESPGIVKEILRQTPLHRRILWKFFYWYQKHGGRGVARIYALMHFNRMA